MKGIISRTDAHDIGNVTWLQMQLRDKRRQKINRFLLFSLLDRGFDIVALKTSVTNNESINRSRHTPSLIARRLLHSSCKKRKKMYQKKGEEKKQEKNALRNHIVHLIIELVREKGKVSLMKQLFFFFPWHKKRRENKRISADFNQPRSFYHCSLLFDYRGQEISYQFTLKNLASNYWFYSATRLPSN